MRLSERYVYKKALEVIARALAEGDAAGARTVALEALELGQSDNRSELPEDWNADLS